MTAMSAGSSKAPLGKSKHNGGRDFRQHAYSQHHNVLLPFSHSCRYLRRCKMTPAAQRVVKKAKFLHKALNAFFH